MNFGTIHKQIGRPSIGLRPVGTRHRCAIVYYTEVVLSSFSQKIFFCSNSSHEKVFVKLRHYMITRTMYLIGQHTHMYPDNTNDVFMSVKGMQFPWGMASLSEGKSRVCTQCSYVQIEFLAISAER